VLTIFSTADEADGRLQMIVSPAEMVLPVEPKAPHFSTSRFADVSVMFSRLVPTVWNVVVADDDVTFDDAVLGSAHNGAGSVAMGAATNAERRTFRSDRLVMDLFFMDSD
jgi:hypothetical protein